MRDTTPGPHQGQPLVQAGTPVKDAHAALVLVHGRGASARSIIQFGRQVSPPEFVLLAPQAADNEWYPQSFLAPVEQNEPGRRSGLQAIDDAVETAREASIPTERIALAGFSQGACLVSEYVARNPDRYGGLAVLSGGLLGETVDPADYQGALDGTPVFLGCSDVDPHIPEQRVHETATVFESLGAAVDTRIYDGMAHTVNDDELDAVAAMLADLD
ncbi:dienelactone hydrolase family protein [Halodesulfurarchaeum sp. HSR-GB]|uniref:alpha/beta hydrolase n=1 Tax=Halodesulfurarchaeum sp. HSR-GB TaxID=3074077 RepID=UPI0028603E5F|nr:dienelactone hydrolase family protein [Halodesulfurarchaeum sp. HSR-GB]MDR5656282.1 dienelactone hydrolase family protein [Halodesulfurarchaeum sp. HSR-GB]